MLFLLWRRYSRSGPVASWFYIVMSFAFAALVVWAAIRGDWIVAALACLMISVTVGGRVAIRRFAHALDSLERRVAAEEDEQDG